MLNVRLWVREDNEEPKAIPGDGTLPPGPGLVVDVEARSAREARHVYALASAAPVDELEDADGWNAQRKAQRRIKPVARFVLEAGKLVRAAVTMKGGDA